MKKTKIFIDTNFFLNFYQSNTDKLRILKDLRKHSSYLIFPEQVYYEFLRNRDGILSNLFKSFVASCKINIHTSSLIQNFPTFKKLKKIEKNFQNVVKKVKQNLEDVKNNLDDDPVYNAFYDLYNSKKSVKLPISDILIKKAHERYLLGNPPGNDKKTIGDQLIWEILISNLKENLIIVARDKTYKNNSLFLKKEFNKITNKELIIITEKISDALQEIGVKSSDEIIELEEKQEVELFPVYFNYFDQPIPAVTVGSFTDPIPAVNVGAMVYPNWAIVDDRIIVPPEYGNCKTCGKYSQLYEGKCFKCHPPNNH